MSLVKLHEEERDGFRFTVVHDEDSYSRWDDRWFECEEHKEEYLRKLKNETIIICGVLKEEKCKCCDQWKQIDSLWGIDADDALDALNTFINY